MPIAAAALASGACKRDREIDGVGGWSLERTTLGDATGVCTPDDELTWCHSNPAIEFGEQRATVDLYFRGHEGDAPLVEILLAMNACRPAEVEGILTNQLGEPDVRQGSLLRWDGTYAITFAQLEGDRGSCEVNFVDPGDEKRIAALSDPTGGDESSGDESSDDPSSDDDSEAVR